MVEDDALSGAAIVMDAGWSEWRWLRLLVWRLFAIHILMWMVFPSILIFFIVSLIVVFVNMLTLIINS